MYNIYKITNKINGKMYVGLTRKTIDERFNEHINISNRMDKNFKLIHKAIRKYGKENFKLELVEDNIKQLTIACEREIYYINEFDTFNSGYNLTLGGEGRKGYKPSKETMNKIKKSLNKICENGKTVAQNSYIKRNETLLSKDNEALKIIGKKSSETQKKNGKHNGKNNKNYNNNKIILFNDFGEKETSFYFYDLRNMDFTNIPNKRMIELSLRTHKPMYLKNNRGEHAKKYRGWLACYETELYCDINVKFVDFEYRENIKKN